jgi:hypothetical protein
MVTAGELDRAMNARKLELTRRNARAVKCQCCGHICPPGTAARLWIDGHKRGYLRLVPCAQGLGRLHPRSVL